MIAGEISRALDLSLVESGVLNELISLVEWLDGAPVVWVFRWGSEAWAAAEDRGHTCWYGRCESLYRV